MADRPLILLTNAIHPDAAALLAGWATTVVAPDTSPDTLRRLVADADGIIVRALLPDDILDHAPRLKGIVRHGVGVDFVPVSAATARRVPVTNLPGCNTQAVAEYAIAALLHLRRGLAGVDALMRTEGWPVARAVGSAREEIGGSTLGIVGMGAIGRHVAGIARAGFGIAVLGTTRRPGSLPEGIEEVGLEALFGRSDAVVVACALTPETQGLVSRERIALMPAGAVLVNVARGRVVDTQALAKALQAGALGGAALDVHDPEPLPADSALFGCPNLLLTPHVAGLTATSFRAMGLAAVEEMGRIVRGERPKHAVNPEIWAGGR